MRTLVIGLASVPFVIALAAPACGGTAKSGFGKDSGVGGSTGSGGAAGSGGTGGFAGSGGSAGSGGTSGIGLGDSGGGGKDSQGDVIVTTKTIVYAHSDTTLYTLDPTVSPPTITMVGNFAGMGGTTYDTSITDLAVNAAGDVYVNTETVVYSAVVPTSPGTVNLTKLTAITPPPPATYVSFYALAFAPAGAIGSGEALIGGDSAGEVWAIDTTGSTIGKIHDLGNFGKVPGKTDGSIFGLSGDIVFYTASGVPNGLATIRECAAGGKTCTATNDYLAGIDMKAIATAYTSGTPASSLLGGIYGGSSTSVGNGTTYGRLFGLGAWGGNVYAFDRAETTAPTNPPQLISIDTSTGTPTSGKGTIVPTPSVTFTSGGWSGAGVSTTVTITVPPPPPPPPQPK